MRYRTMVFHTPWIRKSQSTLNGQYADAEDRIAEEAIFEVLREEVDGLLASPHIVCELSIGQGITAAGSMSLVVLRLSMLCQAVYMADV
jgi:hypothetical protein